MRLTDDEGHPLTQRGATDGRVHTIPPAWACPRGAGFHQHGAKSTSAIGSDRIAPENYLATGVY
jgi:hypothetical protein